MKIGYVSMLLIAILFAVSVAAVIKPDAQVVGHGEREDGYALTVAAHGDEDGTDGTATLVDGETRSRLKMDITDITINNKSGTSALLTAIVTKGTGDYEDVAPGTAVKFLVVDNGEGNSETPDSFQLPSGGPFKTEKVPGPIVKGNFQVSGVWEPGDGSVPPAEEATPIKK